MTLDVPRVIDTADALRALPYHSPMKGWHSHGATLVPTHSCHACNELRRRKAEKTAERPPQHEAEAGGEGSARTSG